QPDLPEAHLAIGEYYYRGRRDYDRALKELELARSGAPAEATNVIAFVQRRQGKFDDAIQNQREAVRLDPRSSDGLRELADSLMWTRRYAEADGVIERAMAIAPDSPFESISKAVLHEAWKGESQLARAVLSELRGGLRPRFTLSDWQLGMLERNPREALTFL